MTLPAFAVQINFVGPFQTPGTWVDITPWVTGLKTDMGRQHELMQVESSSLNVTLDNRDSRFSPWNTSGPYASMGSSPAGLQPLMPIRVQATWPVTGGTTYPVFYGYIESWTPAWGGGPTDPELHITACDVLGLVSLQSTNFTAYRDDILAASCVSYWRMDSKSETQRDWSGHNNDLQMRGTAKQFQVEGALTIENNTAIDLSGQAWFVAKGGGVSTAAPFSVIMWAKLDGGGRGGYLFQQGSDATNGAGAGLTLSIAPGAPPMLQLTQGSTLLSLPWPVDGQWHMIQVWGSATQLGLVIDSGVAATSTAWTPVETNRGDCWIGVDAQFQMLPVIYASIFDGSIDEVSLHTTSTVQLLYPTATAGSGLKLTGDRVNEYLNLAGIPASQQIPNGTGVSQIQPIRTSASGTVLSLIQQIADTENGLLYQAPTGVMTLLDRHYPYTAAAATTSQATFSDSGAAGTYPYLIDAFDPALDDLDLWNECTVTVQKNDSPQTDASGETQSAVDATSRARWGRRAYPNSKSLLARTDLEGQAFAQWIIAKYAQPAQRVRTIELDSTTNDGGNLPQMLGRALWDRVTVQFSGLVGGAAFQQDSWIEGIEHSLDVSAGRLVTTFRLSPAANTRYFTLDDAVLGKLDSGNHIAY